MHVQLVPPHEADKIIKQLQAEKRGNPRHLNLFGGVSIKGSAEVICREADSGKVVWEDKIDNAITDLCRMLWMDNLMYNCSLGVSANTESIDFRRYMYIGPNTTNDVPETSYFARSLTGTTASWSTTFGVPSSTRTIGCIALGGNAAGIGLFVYAGLLLSPPKTQTTSQTLEVIYKLTATGIA